MHEKVLWRLREHAMKIINFEKEEMKLLMNEQQESYGNAKVFVLVKKG